MNLVSRFLADNPRIEAFCPELKGAVVVVLEGRRGKNTRSRRSSANNGGSNCNQIESVRFQSETDNIENFPTDRLFQDFKKQRDLFYDILRSWKAAEQEFSIKNSSNNYKSSFVDKFGDKVRRLLQTQHHPVNMAHLAKLFREQMISTCLSEAQGASGEDVLQLKTMKAYILIGVAVRI